MLADRSWSRDHVRFYEWYITTCVVSPGGDQRPSSACGEMAGWPLGLSSQLETLVLGRALRLKVSAGAWRFDVGGAAARFAPPWPAFFDFEHQSPAQEGADEDEAGEHPEARKGRLQRHRLHDVGGDEDLEAQQQGATDSDAVLVVAALPRRLVEEPHRRPDEADDDDDDAEHVDADADDPDPVAEDGFERREFGGDMVQGVSL